MMITAVFDTRPYDREHLQPAAGSGQVKNFCSLLLLANGTSMLVAGDEFMNTQRGNSNPYNPDNETTWLDWDLLEANRDVCRFFKLMIAFRQAHPAISRGVDWRDDVRWYGVGPQPDLGHYSHSLACCLHGATMDADDRCVMINGRHEDLEFTSPCREAAHLDCLRVLQSSCARLVICPLQDVLGLGRRARMNVPGTAHGNWNWRLDSSLPAAVAKTLRLQPEMYGRGRSHRPRDRKPASQPQHQTQKSLKHSSDTA